MPTSGTCYYKYDDEWQLQYEENLTIEEKHKIIDILTTHHNGLWPESPYGDVIEDRNSQISISFLGQLAPAKEKYEWFKLHQQDRVQLQVKLALLLPEFEVKMGGSTTIDVTRKGIDKAYGINKLMSILNVKKEDILFIGDKLEEGGNDYPVKLMGVDTISVDCWQDTIKILNQLLVDHNI